MTVTATRCRTCGVELPYPGVGRPAVFCDDHRPETWHPRRKVLTAVERYVEPTLPGFPEPEPVPTVHVSAHERRVSGRTSPPLARNSDPSTSHRAAPKDPDKTERQILQAFLACGPMTADQLCDAVNALYPDTWKTALSRCSKAGWLCEAGEGVSNRGRAMAIHTLTEYGRARALEAT